VTDIDAARKALKHRLFYVHETEEIDMIVTLLGELERLRKSKVAVLEIFHDGYRALAPGEVAVPAEDLRAAVAWMDAAADMVGAMGPLGELKTRLRGLVEEGEA